MKNVKTLILMAVAVLLVSSCGTTSKSGAFTTPTRLELQMSDLQYLGESEISCDYSVYLGLIRRIETVNGQRYVPGNDVSLSVPGLTLGNKGLGLAASKLLEDYPTAEYFQVVQRTKKRDVLFLGSSVKCKAKVRAYRFVNPAPAEK